MDTRGPCHCGKTLDAVFHFAFFHTHKLGHFVDHDDDLRNFGHIVAHCGLLIVTRDVSYVELFEHIEPSVHFADCPVQCVDGLICRGDDFLYEKVRNALINGKFHFLRIDEDKPYVLRRIFVK